MELFTFFALALGLASCFFGAISFIFVMLFNRFKDWPVIWASSLLGSFTCALSACVFFILPTLHPQKAFQSDTMNATLEPLQGMVLLPSTYIDSASNGYFLSLGAIYLIGSTFAIIRLFLGRRYARNIAKKATPFRSQSGTSYRVSEEHLAPFILSSMFNKKHCDVKTRSKENHIIVISGDLHSRLTPSEIEHILWHELSHHIHCDDQVGLLLRIIVSLSWFCPFSYWMFNRWEQGVELRSDLSSLFDKPKSLRRAYANTLLKALQLTANRVRQYPAASFSTDHLRNEKMRIKSILHGDESTFKGFSSKLAIVSGAAFITLGMATIVSTTTYAKEASTSNLIGKNMALIMSGRLTASFGLAPDPFKANAQRDHKGIDVAAPLGTPIYAPEDGVVIEATDVYDNKPKYGKVVLIETSNNTKTLFAHLNSYSVEPGQRFKTGTLLATVGETGVATGPHVHMETYVNDKRVNPLQVWQLAE